MDQPKHVQAPSAATHYLLRPLVRILLPSNIPHRTFAELAKLVYLEVATAKFRITGKKQTVSRIAIRTGLTRKEVHRLLAHPLDAESVVEEGYHRASRVITDCWVRDHDSGTGRAILTRFGWRGSAIIQCVGQTLQWGTYLCARCWTNYFEPVQLKN